MDYYAMPSIDEILNGIEELICEHYEQSLGAASEIDMEKVKE